jgi:hypothetical protein
MDLFGAPPPDLPRHKMLAGDLERVVTLATDGTQPPRLRAEAQAIVRIHEGRTDRIARRNELDAPLVLPLGLLLLVPAHAVAKKGARHGA